MKLKINRRISGILFWIWAIALIILHVLPSTPDLTIKTDGFELRMDYLEHFVVFGIMGFLLVLWKLDISFQIPLRRLLILLFMSILFSYSLEFIQKFVPGRAYNIIDAICNTLGILSGTYITYFILIKRLVTKEKIVVE